MQAFSNLQHGDTYLSPALDTAVRYASTNRFGSELLSYTLDLLLELYVQFREHIPTGPRDRFPEVIRRIDLPAAPLVIRIDGIPESWLLTEHCGDPKVNLEFIENTQRESPDLVEVFCQQHNFRLIKPVPVASLRVWLVNLTHRDPMSPEYDLLPLTLP